MTRILAWAGVALLVACAPIQEPLQERRDSEAYRAFQAAKTLGPEGPVGVVDQLEAFLERWPDHALSDDAALLRARMLRRLARPEQAESQLDWLLREHPRATRAQEARLLLARLRLDRGDVEGADRMADSIRISRLPDEERPAAHRLRADLARERGEPVRELRWLSWLRADTRDEDARALVDVEIDELIARLPPADLVRAADQLGKRDPAGRIRLHLAEYWMGRGDPESAREQLELAARMPLTPVQTARREALRQRLAAFESLGVDPGGESWTGAAGLDGRAPPSTAGARGTLGVVLPLSGSFAAFGEEALQGMLLAADVFGSGPGGPAAVRLVVRDSGGTPEGAAAAVRELGADGRIVAVLGPLLGDESEGAAVAAEEVGVPLVALTAREEVARGRPSVMRVGLTPRTETGMLVAYAASRLDATRYAILYPQDEFGSALKDRFWEAVEARGGRVTALAAYSPGANDFADPIRSLIGYLLLTGGESAALAEREKLLDKAKRLPLSEAVKLREEAAEMTGPGDRPLPPIVDFDVLFVPDTYEKVALIAPQLAFHDVRGVTLMGPGGWYHPDLVGIGGKHMEGAVFTEPFFPQSEVPFVADFTRRFEAAYGAEPGALAAQAFDAANLVLVQLAEGRDSRDDVRQGLLATRGYPGVSGLTTLLADGNAQKRPYLLGVRDGEVMAVD